MSVMALDRVRRGDAPDRPAAQEMSPAIALSAALHVVVIALIALGLPNLFRVTPPQDTPIAVELVTIAPQTRATHPNPYRPQPKASPEPAIAPPTPEPKPKPEPPAAAAPPPPSASAPPPSPLAAPPKPEFKPPPPPPPPPKPVEAKAPPPPPEPKPKPEQPQARFAARPEEHKAETAEFAKMVDKLAERHEDRQPQPAAFDALLKNLSRQKTALADDAPPISRRMAAMAPPSSQPRAPLGSQLTASEIDLLRQQIERCWDVPAGARDAQNLDIEIKAVVNRDGSVQQAMIVDMARYATDPFFRAAADSAKRALLNPQCSPLPVPPDKYEAWHNLDLTFNPKDLL